MEDPSRYRNKTQVPFGYVNGEVVAGFYQKRTHEITNMKSCLIQTDISDQIVDTMRELCRDLNIDPYNESLNLGVLRHVIVRVGFKTGEIMVINYIIYNRHFYKICKKILNFFLLSIYIFITKLQIIFLLLRVIILLPRNLLLYLVRHILIFQNDDVVVSLRITFYEIIVPI